MTSRQPATEPCPAAGGTSRSTGRLALPVWQAGPRPFLDGGGEIVVDGNGRAVQNGVELGTSGAGVLLDVAIPCGPAPEDGWPVLLWIAGTGGVARATPTELGPNIPYAVFSIAPLYSGDRLVSAPPPFNTSELLYYNYLNPLAGRTNQLQQAADVLYLERLAHAFATEPGEAGGGVDGRFDTSTVVVGGHSQGAGTIPLTLAVAPPNVQGGFMSCAGAGLYHSIVHRGDVRPLVDALLASQPGEIDMFHPYPHVLQTFAEGADPSNYAPAITADLALYAGLRDGCTSIETSVHLAQALDIPIVNPRPAGPCSASTSSRPSPATHRRTSPRSRPRPSRRTCPVAAPAPWSRSTRATSAPAPTPPSAGRSSTPSPQAAHGDRPRPHSPGRPRHPVPTLRPTPDPTRRLTTTSPEAG